MRDLKEQEIFKTFDSIQHIKRSRRHSSKPNRFREIINTLYPSGNRIELFARPPNDVLFEDESYRGWDLWGDEVLAGTAKKMGGKLCNI
jgi:N6-adenosine-specific RNA methylase IME4